MFVSFIVVLMNRTIFRSLKNCVRYDIAICDLEYWALCATQTYTYMSQFKWSSCSYFTKKIDIFKKLLIMFSKLLLERFYLTKLLLSRDYQIKLFYLTRTIPLI